MFCLGGSTTDLNTKLSKRCPKIRPHNPQHSFICFAGKLPNLPFQATSPEVYLAKRSGNLRAALDCASAPAFRLSRRGKYLLRRRIAFKWILGSVSQLGRYLVGASADIVER